MENRKLLISAFVFGGLSLAGNSVLIWQRTRLKEPVQVSLKPAERGVVFDAKASPVPPGGGGQFDFSDTSLEDNSWKLEDKKPEEALQLDRDFKWSEAGIKPTESKESENPATP